VPDSSFDYVIVGAGSAGCVLAARLSEDPAVRVLLVEAGGRDSNPFMRMPLGWQQVWRGPRDNWGYYSEPEPHCGNRRIFLPRGKVLGGTSSINGMLYVRGHPLDYDLWRQQGCAGWSYEDVLPYFRRAEGGYRGDTREHGSSGPLGVSRNDVRNLGFDLIHQTVINAGLPMSEDFATEPEGFGVVDITVKNGRRSSTAQVYLKPARSRPNLTVVTNALTRRVVLVGRRVTGIEYDRGDRTTFVRARREVIVCGGSYNSPQLLLLSGIGPAAELRAVGIAPLHDLPGVGENLQDRYEVAVTHRMRRPWRVLDGATFRSGDPLWRRWRESRAGMYASNGAALALIGRSAPTRPEPDLFCMALLARFEGYRPGFSELIGGPGEMLTWAILKAHTENRAGTVRLRSADPLDTALVDFSYFEEGSDVAGEDLAAVVAGVRFVRSLTAPLIAAGLIAEELAPGAAVASDAEIAQYVRDTAWGHHASGSCAIGAGGDAKAVLDSAFRVRGTQRLRVVDASVFPRIPGFFIASAVYMAAEKAADAILADARATAPERASTTLS